MQHINKREYLTKYQKVKILDSCVAGLRTRIKPPPGHMVRKDGDEVRSMTRRESEPYHGERMRRFNWLCQAVDWYMDLRHEQERLAEARMAKMVLWSRNRIR
jgi:hypothetical protein